MTFEQSEELSIKTPRIYRMEEHGKVDIPADDLLINGCLNVFPNVIKKGYFSVHPTSIALNLQAGGFVGIIPLNENVVIDVQSRVPIGNLMRVLKISGEPIVPLEGVNQKYDRDIDLFPSLVDLYAQSLCDYIDDVLHQGLYREYERKETATSFPRGRILLSDTVKSLLPIGITHKVVSTWFQRTPDVPVNQCLKYALWLISSFRIAMGLADPATKSRKIDAALNRAFLQLNGVTLDLSCHFLNDPVVAGREELPQTRSYYRGPLALARTIISRRAVTLRSIDGDVAMNAFVLNMADIFESYLRNVLAKHSNDSNEKIRVLDGNKKVPHGGSQRFFTSGTDRTNATPDIVLKYEDDESKPVVIEVKYKPSPGVERNDLNQVVSYGASYACRHVVLAQPRGSSPSSVSGLRSLGMVGSLSVGQYTFDLNSDNIEDEERRFATSVFDLVTKSLALTTSGES